MKSLNISYFILTGNDGENLIPYKFREEAAGVVKGVPRPVLSEF